MLKRITQDGRRLTKIILVIVIIGLAFLSVGVYAYSWNGSSTQQVLRVVPLPGAMIGWYPIRLEQILDLQNTLEHYGTALNQSSPEVFQIPVVGEPRRQALEIILRDRAILALAKRHGVVVTKVDVDQAFTAQLTQGGGRLETEQIIRDLYNWTPQQFKQEILWVAVARTKLREQLAFDNEINQTVRQQAEQVLALVQAGQTPFDELAKTYSQDEQATAGGDLGWVSRGDQNQPIDEVAFELVVGQTSQLIHSKFGFHILKVEAEREESAQRQVHLRQIFIASTPIDEVITAYLKQQGVRVFISGLDWDQQAGQVKVR